MMTQNQFNMENILHEKIISGMCRLCLSSNGTLIDMFSFSSELESQIADAVSKCTPVHVKKHSELPTTICESCYMQLIKTHNFQMQALKSDKTLQMYLQRLHVDDKQTIFRTSVILPDIDLNSCVLANQDKVDNQDNSTNCEEIKPCVKYLESDCDEFETDIVENKVFTLDSKSGTEWDVYNSSEDSTFNPNLIVKAESFINENGKGDQFDAETEILSDIAITQETMKLENKDISTDKMITSYKCDVCKKCFSESSKLRIHQRIHRGTKSYQCEICNRCFSMSSHLHDHIRTHTGEKPYQCDVCNKSFSKLNNLRTHKRVHSGEKPYQCDVCKKCFSASANLRTHQRVHSGEKPYQCDVCSKYFSSSANWRKHQRIHSGEKPYQCDVCNKCFSNSANLSRHQRIHTDEKSYQRDVSNKYFSNSDNLSLPHHCDVCNKCFSDSSNLRTHQRVHSGEKPYQCKLCNKCFSQSSSLVRHTLIHSGEKPYQCAVCNKCFSQESHLNRHNLTHTGEKPYQCDVCNRCFSQLSGLNSHKRIH